MTECKKYNRKNGFDFLLQRKRKPAFQEFVLLIIAGKKRIEMLSKTEFRQFWQ